MINFEADAHSLANRICGKPSLVVGLWEKVIFNALEVLKETTLLIHTLWEAQILERFFFSPLWRSCVQ